MRQAIEHAIANVCKELFNVETGIELSRPDEQFGDYATNVALRLAKELNKKPREVGEQLAAGLRTALATQVTEINVAGPGFINIRLTDQELVKALFVTPAQSLAGQQVLVEFGDPNPLKAMHLGHLYTTIIGDTIAHLLSAAGADVKRLSYHGDVGMHVAKAIYGIGEAIGWDAARLSELEAEEIELNGTKLDIKTVIGYLYAQGAQAFEAGDEQQARIREINKKVYSREDEVINTIYHWGVERSFTYFDIIFSELGVQYDQRYLESQSTPIGVEIVTEQTGKVFEQSDGAVIYRGEKVGLHTRVFINSEGLPTYEAKDLGLAQLKNKDYPKAVQSIIITANEQTEYFRVMLAALGEIDQELANKTIHIAHGFLSLTSGKMSSRTGQVYGAQELLDATTEVARAAYPESEVQRDVYLAAIKYTFLKNRIGGDIVFDIEESVAMEGNSGPYLQYAHARARSILGKVEVKDELVDNFEPTERQLLKKIGEFAEVVDRSVAELMPHHICTYLYELAQVFNRFYEHNRVIDDPRENIRLQLVQAYADTLKKGLGLLNIPAPDRM